jgi:hypothetical protein
MSFDIRPIELTPQDTKALEIEEWTQRIVAQALGMPVMAIAPDRLGFGWLQLEFIKEGVVVARTTVPARRSDIEQGVLNPQAQGLIKEQAETIFGLPVVVDEDIPEGMVVLKIGDKFTARIVYVGVDWAKPGADETITIRADSEGNIISWSVVKGRT